MSDYVLIPISDTDAARVQCPLALDEREAFLDALTPDDLAAAEHVLLPGAVAPILSPVPSEDGR